MRGGKLHTVSGKNCVLACYNGMIPYICPDVPAEQSKALSYLVKSPLVYTHVALRNWEPFAKLNVHHIVAPGGYHTYTALDFPVSLGAYKFPASPKSPPFFSCCGRRANRAWISENKIARGAGNYWIHRLLHLRKIYGIN